jgi:hypothetical protein
MEHPVQPRYTKSRKQYQRTDSTLNELAITELHITIFSALVRYRRLRSSHLLALLGAEGDPQRADTVGRVLRALYDHGYLDREPEPWRKTTGGSAPLIYRLDRKGASALRHYHEQYHISPFLLRRLAFAQKPVGEFFLKHVLSVADVMVAIETACTQHGSVRLIHPEEILSGASSETRRADKPFCWEVEVEHHGTSKPLSIEPDYVFGIRFTNRPTGWNTLCFALEVDRGKMPVWRHTLTQTSLYRKLRCYMATRRAGLYATRFNLPHVRVLTSTTNAERVQHIVDMIAEHELDREAAYRAGDFLFTQTDALLAAPDPFALPWRNGQGSATLPLHLPPVRDPDKFFDLLLHEQIRQTTQEDTDATLPLLMVTVMVHHEPTAGDTTVSVRAVATIRDVVIECERRVGKPSHDVYREAEQLKQAILAHATNLAVPLRIVETPPDALVSHEAHEQTRLATPV